MRSKARRPRRRPGLSSTSTTSSGSTTPSGWSRATQLLAAVARNLTASLSATDTIAHVVGDEFVVVREGVAGHRAGARRARRPRPRRREPPGRRGRARAGRQRERGSGARRERVGGARRAAAAGRSAPPRSPSARAGRAGWSPSAARPRGTYASRWSTSCRDALTRGELTLHYQPLVRVDGAARRLRGAPALAAPDPGDPGARMSSSGSPSSRSSRPTSRRG